jgi:hypothetical protein
MTSFKFCALLYGIVFTLLGIFGFISTFYINDLLFGLFKVNIATNIIHFLTGAIGLMVMGIQKYYTRLYFQLIGFIYAALAVLGFLYGENSILGFIGHNAFLTWLHVIASVIALILGFGTNHKLDTDRK